MAVDWIADSGYEDDLVAPPQGFAVRLSFLKLKESLGNKVKYEEKRGLKLWEGG